MIKFVIYKAGKTFASKSLSVAKGAAYKYTLTVPEGYDFNGFAFTDNMDQASNSSAQLTYTVTDKANQDETQKFYAYARSRVIDGKEFFEATKLSNDQYRYAIWDRKKGASVTYKSKTKSAYWTYKSGIIDGKSFVQYTKGPDNKYYFAIWHDGKGGVFS